MSDNIKSGHPTQGTQDWLELVELNARLMGRELARTGEKECLILANSRF